MSLDIWISLPVTVGVGQNCRDCEQPLMGTRYAHRDKQDTLFCSALCCVFHYLQPEVACDDTA